MKMKINEARESERFSCIAYDEISRVGYTEKWNQSLVRATEIKKKWMWKNETVLLEVAAKISNNVRVFHFIAKNRYFSDFSCGYWETDMNAGRETEKEIIECSLNCQLGVYVVLLYSFCFHSNSIQLYFDYSSFQISFMSSWSIDAQEQLRRGGLFSGSFDCINFFLLYSCAQTSRLQSVTEAFVWHLKNSPR